MIRAIVLSLIFAFGGGAAHEVDVSAPFVENLQKLSIPEDFRLPDVSIGNPKAKHTVVAYLSFSCGHCRDFFLNEFPKLKMYTKEKQLRIILRCYLDDMAAFDSAVLMRSCGEEKNQEILFYQKIYENLDEWTRSPNKQSAQAFLKKVFMKAGCPKKLVDDSMDINSEIYKKFSAGLMKNMQDAMIIHKIDSIPAFIVDDVVYLRQLNAEKIVELCELKKQNVSDEANSSEKDSARIAN